MVLAGAIGNMIDRIFYASTDYCVVDWIDFYWFWGYVFNIADCCIVIAAFMLIVYIIVQEVKDYRAKNKTIIKQADAPKKVLSKTERELEEAKTKKDEHSE